MLAPIVMRTSMRAIAQTTSTTAGSTVVQCRSNARENRPDASIDPAEEWEYSASPS